MPLHTAHCRIRGENVQTGTFFCVLVFNQSTSRLLWLQMVMMMWSSSLLARERNCCTKNGSRSAR